MRRAIVAALRHCPGSASVEVLMKALKWDDIGVSAITSLGAHRVVAAIPEICDRLDELEGHEFNEVLRVLGEIGHTSAVGTLIRHLRACNIADGHDEYRVDVIARSLAAIGGTDASTALEPLMSGTTHTRSVVETVIARCDPASLAVLTRIAEVNTEVLDHVVAAMSHRDLTRFLPVSQWGAERGISVLHIGDELSRLVLQRLKTTTDPHAGFDLLVNPFYAAGHLPGSEPLAWLQSLMDDPSIQTRSTKSTSDSRSICRWVLADRGIEEFVTERVDRELEIELGRSFRPLRLHFEQFPRHLVRKRLLACLSNRPVDPCWMALFGAYAGPEDRALLVELEEHPDINVGDLAHQLIAWEGFLNVSSA